MSDRPVERRGILMREACSLHSGRRGKVNIAHTGMLKKYN